MKVLSGTPVSAGVAIGTAIILDTEGQRIPPRHIEANQVDAELNRMREAFAVAAREARESQQAISNNLGQQFGEIFAAHAQLLEGSIVIHKCEVLIREELYG